MKFTAVVWSQQRDLQQPLPDAEYQPHYHEVYDSEDQPHITLTRISKIGSQVYVSPSWEETLQASPAIWIDSDSEGYTVSLVDC
jgi:hypothetical protein